MGTAIEVPNMDGQGRYTELTPDEQEQAYRQRIKLIEQNQFILRMELAEMGALRYAAATDQEVKEAATEIEVLTQKLAYGETRLKALRSFLTTEDTNDGGTVKPDESTVAG